MGFARVYILATPYANSELFDVGYEQAADVMYLTHVSHPPYKLSRYGNANWTLNPVDFGTLAIAPTNVTATASGSTSASGYSAKTYDYVVTTIDATTGQESLQSVNAECVNDLTIDGHTNLVSWSAVANASRYSVYRLESGVYGYIGSTVNVSLPDQNIGPDTGNTPPGNTTPFSGANLYPAIVTLHQQRAIYGRTNTGPSSIYTTRSADLENLNTSFPLKVDDAITLNLVARQVNSIQNLVSLNAALVALTQDAIFSVAGGDGGVLVGNNIPDIRVQSYRGASKVRPVTIDETIFYTTAKGSAVRTLGYTFESDGYKGDDITVYAPHFFRGFQVVEMAWAEYPTATLWCVRSDGALIALTWQAEQNVWGWSLCQIAGGFVESVAAISVGAEDVPYFVVRRMIDGTQRRYIERGGSSLWTDHTQAVYVDCASAYTGAPATGLIGLQHLEGEVVDVLADGFVLKAMTVRNGMIMFPSGAGLQHCRDRQGVQKPD